MNLVAQWKGQFTGHTHQTKVDDLEASLRLAVAALSESPDPTKAKTAERLAARLLNARLKLMKSRRYEAPFGDGSNPVRAESKHQQEEQLRAGGIDAILNEFGAVL